MPKYLIKASYTAEGLKGVLKEGGVDVRLHDRSSLSVTPCRSWPSSPPCPWSGT